MSLKALQAFWTDPKSLNGSEPALRAWYKVAESAGWRNFADLRADFRSTDKVGDCYVFDVANNNIRLIAFVRFADAERSGLVLVRMVMTHAEYDKNTWPDECGSHKPRPVRPAAKAKKKKK